MIKMRKRIWLIVFIALLITILSISNTFALFETNSYANKDFNIGVWEILLNNNDISLANTITLNQFQYSTSSHTEDNYFAPGRSATFDIVIDASLCDVSVSYDLEIDTDEIILNHPNIDFSITNVNTNEVITNNTYNGIISLNDQNRTVTLRMAVTWNNNVLYDENDTDLIDGSLEFLINANFEQYLG